MVRFNRFNEAYCTDAADVQRELERKEYDPARVYAVEIPAAKGERPALEVLDNVDGATVLFIEGESFATCRAIAAGCNIQLDV